LRIEPAELVDFLPAHAVARAAKREAGPERHERLPQVFDDVWERRQTKPAADPLPKTTGSNENQPPDPRPALEQQHLRHASTEGMTDDVGGLDAYGFQPSRDDPSVPVELVTDVRAGGPTVARQIEHQHPPVSAQERRNARPRKGRIVEPVQENDGRKSGILPYFGPVEVDAFDLHEMILQLASHDALSQPT
jgi:hypothetical protein